MRKKVWQFWAPCVSRFVSYTTRRFGSCTAARARREAGTERVTVESETGSALALPVSAVPKGNLMITPQQLWPLLLRDLALVLPAAAPGDMQASTMHQACCGAFRRDRIMQ